MATRRLMRYLPTLLVAGLVTLSCGRDRAPTAPVLSRSAPQLEAEGSGGGDDGSWGEARKTGALAYCRTMPYFADTAVIGPDGGMLNIGPHKLVIPAGALDTAVTIIGDAPSDTVRSVRLFPEGLRFHDEAQLTLSYAGCQSAPGFRPHRIAYTDDSLNIRYFLESQDNPARNRVTAELEHFSRYAVGW